MILAHHSLDRHAQQQVTDEHDVCADCWQDTVAAVDAPGSLLISSGPLPGMDTSGVVTGPTVNWLLRVIDGCLRAEELDRRRPADPEVLRNVLAGMAVSLDENFPP
jgi:hypothetical protein